MLICQVLLKLQILVDRLLELFLPELFFDGVKLISEFRLLFSPFFEVLSQVGCFLVECPRVRFAPTCLGYILKVLFHDPPILKTERFISASMGE